MPRGLNGHKSKMFTNGGQGDYASRAADYDLPSINSEQAKGWLRQLQRTSLVSELMNQDTEFQAMHDAGNDRIYSAFLTLDQHVRTHGVQRANSNAPMFSSFAPG